MLIRFRAKLTLAALSGASIPILYIVFDYLPFTSETAGMMLFFGIPGVMFAGGVFWPYLKLDRYFWLRAALIVAVSIASYRVAYQVALEIGEATGGKWGEPGLDGFVVASIVGAAIVLLAAIPIVPLRPVRLYWVLAVLTSIASGVLFGIIYSEDPLTDMIAYAQWHAFVCVVVHYGIRRD